MYLLRRDVLIASFDLARPRDRGGRPAGSQRFSRRLNRIVIFASRIAAGELSARVEEGNLDEISEVAHALDATASRLEQSFHALWRPTGASLRRSSTPCRKRSSPSMRKARSAGPTRSCSASRRARFGKAAPLVHTIRDPEVLACVEGALASREVHRGRATSVAPGRDLRGQRSAHSRRRRRRRAP